MVSGDSLNVVDIDGMHVMDSCRYSEGIPIFVFSGLMAGQGWAIFYHFLRFLRVFFRRKNILKGRNVAI